MHSVHKPSARVIVLLMDSFGIGASLDAEHYGDTGANTFGHIWQACQAENRPLKIPHLTKRGLLHATVASSGVDYLHLDKVPEPQAWFGYAVEQSHGKDTPSGHWELAGVPVLFDWGYFPDVEACFPQSLVTQLISKARLPGILGNKHASGTDIIAELGAEHLASNAPIVYTSADSVLQIAAHEETFGLERLYEVCMIARKLVDEYNIGRVIARPFNGTPGNFTRTGNRRDYASPPPAPTLLNYLQDAGHEVIAIGKTADIFAHQGITQTVKAHGNQALFDASLKSLAKAAPGSLIFTNFVDFDSLWGHRRDVAGYAAGLEAFDARLPELDAALQDDDVVIITADHGCDPTFPGSDHTREHIPVLAWNKYQDQAIFIGRRESFADVGQSIASLLGVTALSYGIDFFNSNPI